jgi:hypothetical protein
MCVMVVLLPRLLLFVLCACVHLLAALAARPRPTNAAAASVALRGEGKACCRRRRAGLLSIVVCVVGVGLEVTSNRRRKSVVER